MISPVTDQQSNLLAPSSYPDKISNIVKEYLSDIFYCLGFESLKMTSSKEATKKTWLAEILIDQTKTEQNSGMIELAHRALGIGEGRIRGEYIIHELHPTSCLALRYVLKGNELDQHIWVAKSGEKSGYIVSSFNTHCRNPRVGDNGTVAYIRPDNDFAVTFWDHQGKANFTKHPKKIKKPEYSDIQIAGHSTYGIEYAKGTLLFHELLTDEDLNKGVIPGHNTIKCDSFQPGPFQKETAKFFFSRKDKDGQTALYSYDFQTWLVEPLNAQFHKLLAWDIQGSVSVAINQTSDESVWLHVWYLERINPNEFLTTTKLEIPQNIDKPVFSVKIFYDKIYCLFGDKKAVMTSFG